MRIANAIGVSTSPVEQQFRAILSEKLRCNSEELPGDATLEELGFDSLGLSDLAEAVQGQIDVEIPNRVFPATFTINNVVEFLVRELEKTSRELDQLIQREPAD